MRIVTGVLCLAIVSDAFRSTPVPFTKRPMTRSMRPRPSSTTLGVFSTSLVSPTNFMVRDKDDEDFLLEDDETLTDESTEEPPDSLLDYLPYTENLPPLTWNLLHRATENYVYGTDHALDDIDAVIRAEYRSYDVPVAIDSVTFDVSHTGEDVDESVAEILSLAALHRLPAPIVEELLEALAPSSSALATARNAWVQSGWEGVDFPQGLALDLKGAPRRPLFRRRRKRAREAQAAIDEAAAVAAPKQRLQTRQEFLQSMQEQFGSDDDDDHDQSPSSGDALFFFPSTSVVGLSWKRLKRTIDKQYATLKTKGKAGLLSYCFFNFCYYTAGVLWQWRRIPPADPFSSSVLTVLVRKFGRVFGSLYLASQLFKIPKLFTAVALTPVSEQLLTVSQRRWETSETAAAAVLIAVMFALWIGLVSLPILGEYASLRKLVRLESFMDVTAVTPAFYKVTKVVMVDC